MMDWMQNIICAGQDWFRTRWMQDIVEHDMMDAGQECRARHCRPGILSCNHSWHASIMSCINHVWYQACPASSLPVSLSDTPHVLCLLCNASILSCFLSYRSGIHYPSGHASTLSCISSGLHNHPVRYISYSSILTRINPVLHSSCQASIFSCIFLVLHQTCPASILSSINTILHQSCPQSILF